MRIKASVVFLFLSFWLAAFPGAVSAQSNDLAEVLKRGQIRVALYKEFPPFSDDGKGIDVDIAGLLAAKLGVKLEILWFDADENMDDDLRNMVWRGTVLGYGPADVMLHVPIEKDYMARNDKVRFLAPYYREKFAVARNTGKIDKLESLDVFRTQRIGVEVETYPDTVLLSADGGAYRSSVAHFKSSSDAVAALKAGEIGAVMGMQSELESGLAGTSGFEVGDIPVPLLNRRQWTLGLAVKHGHEALGRALQEAMNGLLADGSLAEAFKRHGVVYRAP